MYDHVSFHLDEDYPADLPAHHAAHHIGYYYAWAVSQNLHSEAAASLPDFDKLQSNDLGNRFTRYYYADEDEGYGLFMEDYFTTLGIEDDSMFYHTANSSENQSLLNTVFQTGFERWQNSLK